MPTENTTEQRPNNNGGRFERGNNNRGGRRQFSRKREPKEFEDVVVSINRVSKTVKGGRRMRFAALVVVGDKKGRIGFGGVHGASTVYLQPAAPGTGVIAGGAVRSILELAGVSDVLSKVIGSRTSVNVVYATLDALRQMHTVEDVAKLRDKKVSEIR